MKIFDSRKSIVMASIGVLFVTLALVSCEKREEPLLNDIAKYSKTVVFTEQQVQTRATAYTDYNTQMPDADYVLHAEESTDSMFLSAYVTDLESEQLLTRATETTLSTLNTFYILAYNTADNSFNTDLSKAVVPANEEKTVWRYNPNINWSQLGNNEVQFYAYAGVSSGSTQPVSGSTTQFVYTTPLSPTAQTDIVVAKAAKTYRSNNTEQVPLQFNHICAGIRFVEGTKTDINGYIKSIKIHNVIQKGTYDITTNIPTNGWSNLSAANATTFTVADGLTAAVGTGNQVGETLMLVPQPLASDAYIEVTFMVGTKERKLYGSLANVTWKSGKMYTYKISNHRIEHLAFTRTVKLADAHFVIDSIEIYADRAWKLTSSHADVTLTESLIDLQQQGWWLDNKKGSREITGAKITSGTTKKVYIHFAENVPTDGASREITLTLSDNSGSTDVADSKTLKITQLAPTWTLDTLGCERIEESPFEPWGPYWKVKEGDEAYVVYEMPNGLGTFLFTIFEDLFITDENKGFVESEGGMGLLRKRRYKIKYTSFLSQSSSITKSGLINTYKAYYTDDLQNLISFESTLAWAGGTKVEMTFEEMDFTSSAIVASIKKNKHTCTSTEGVNKINDFAMEDMNWFCPSLEECKGGVLQNNPNMVEGEKDLTGATIWTSTAYVPSEGATDESAKKSYIYTISNPATGTGGTSATAVRDETYRVRAVRKKPTQ